MKTAEWVRRALLASSASMLVAALATPGCWPFTTAADKNEPSELSQSTSITLAPSAGSTTGPLAVGAGPRTLMITNQRGNPLAANLFDWTSRVVSGSGAVATLSMPNVTCLSAGTVMVTVKSKAGTAPLEASTTVDCGFRTLVIVSEPSGKIVQVGSTASYRAEVREPNGSQPPGAGTYTYTSSDTSVLAFPTATSIGGSASGQARKPGTVTITVASPLVAQSSTTTLTVAPPFVFIESSPPGETDDLASSRIALGIEAARQFLVRDQLGRVVTSVVQWSSSAPGVADVTRADATTAGGLARCRTGGTTTIRADVAASGLSATATFNCISVTVSPSPVSVRKGETITLTATVVGAAGAVDVNWSANSSDVDVTKLTATTATVRGVNVTAATLPVTVTATFRQGVTTVGGTAAVSVLPSLVPSFVMSPRLWSLASGESKAFTSSTQNVSGTPSIAWMSKDPNILTVSPASGTGTTATASSRLFRDAFTYVVGTMTAGSLTLVDSALVLVGSTPVEIAPKPAPPVSATGTLQFTLNTISGSGAGTGLVPQSEIDWTSSSSVATIGATGLARCNNTSATNATATITATIKVPAGGVARTDFTTLTCLGVAPATGFTLTPGSVTLAQGTTAVPQPSIVVTRTGGFTGGMQVSSITYTPPGSTVPGPLPAGLTVTATPPATGGGSFFGNALTFNVSAASTVPAGTYPLTINVSSGLPTQSTTLTVVVTGSTTGGQIRVVLDPMALELTEPGGFQYVAHLFNAAGAEITAASDGGTISFTSGNRSILDVSSLQASLGMVLLNGTGSTTVTAVYTRGTTTVASSALSPVTVFSGVNAQYASVAVRMVGSSTQYPSTLRRISVGQTVEFDLLVKDPTGNTVLVNVDGGVTFARSDNAAISNPTLLPPATPPTPPTPLRYSFKANALPSSSAVPGVPNIVWLQVDIEGAMVRVPFQIVP